jgi:predicted nucleic acid-binding protein
MPQSFLRSAMMLPGTRAGHKSGLIFGSAQAAVAAQLYGMIKRPKGREIDLAVAACALHDGAALWTLNRADFRDLPGLVLI